MGSRDKRRITGQELYREARKLIPGGTQLLSKRPEWFAPEQWPPYYSEAKGCEVIDVDGNRYIDMSLSGISACLLGYNDPDVTAAVVRRVERGSMCTLNDPAEVEVARRLVELHPWSECVRYARTGGESMAVAVRIARAHTGRDVVAFCGYHGWSDWYLAANLPTEKARDDDSLQGHLLPGLEPQGVPAGLAGTALPFRYNHLDELQEIVKKHGSRLAAVVMEPTRADNPEPGFLEGVRQLCDEVGAVMVFDEISMGWRLHLGGAHLLYGVDPDIAVFAKSLGNGHPIAAVIGRRETMEASQSTFISSTYWTEGVGFAAALATLEKMKKVDVPAHVERIGLRFRGGMARVAEKHGVPLRLAGHPAVTALVFEHPEALGLQTLLTVRMLAEGILAAGVLSATLAHTEKHVDTYLEVADKIFPELAEAIEKGDIDKRIGGPSRHAGFGRLA
jgi:glutamate-1-semialdehyde 2,1-aminomutase